MLKLETGECSFWGSNLTSLRKWYFRTCYKQNAFNFNLAHFSVKAYFLFAHSIMHKLLYPTAQLENCSCSCTCYLWSAGVSESSLLSFIPLYISKVFYFIVVFHSYNCLIPCGLVQCKQDSNVMAMHKNKLILYICIDKWIAKEKSVA